MIQKPFAGFIKHRIEYETISTKPSVPENIQKPKRVILFSEKTSDQNGSALVEPGDTIKTGQRLLLFRDSDEYVVSTITGTISAIASYVGDFGRTYTSVEIDADETDERDGEFETASKDPSLENVLTFLEHIPGNPSFRQFADPEKPVRTIVITGTDPDLLITTSQYVVKSDMDAIKQGIKIIRKITGIDHIVMTVPVSMMQDAANSGVEIKTVNADYPAANHRLIAGAILGKPVPAGESLEDAGICFLNAESVASIGTAFTTGQIPFTKLLTCIKKSGEKILVSARIGTLLKDIFQALDITLNSKDRIIIGGPMTGSSVYSEDYPVRPDTDAIMVQSKNDAPQVSDMACINCGECIRICPTRVPVNLLVRYLEAGQYQEAADRCDLNSCIECGLCSLVCTAKIPIFQYIRLANYELARTLAAEANNA